MIDLIETPNQLRKHLGDDPKPIKDLDRSLRKRDETKCACCSRWSRVQVAHIIPIEVGGKTNENNLVLLRARLLNRLT
jgi:5-methylcytosine-specific restriction endonuclease McrA